MVGLSEEIGKIVNLLEDVPNKQEITEYTVELYNKCK